MECWGEKKKHKKTKREPKNQNSNTEYTCPEPEKGSQASRTAPGEQQNRIPASNLNASMQTFVAWGINKRS